MPATSKFTGQPRHCICRSTHVQAPPSLGREVTSCGHDAPVRSWYAPTLEPTWPHPAGSSDTPLRVSCSVGCRVHNAPPPCLFQHTESSQPGVLAGFHPMFTRVVEVEMHLPRLGIAEAADLQIDNDQASQAPIKNTKSTRNQVSSIRRRRCRPMNAKSSPSLRRKSAKC